MKATRIPYSEFKRIYAKVPRLCVDLVIKDREGVVLSKRDIEPSKGMWHLPGGTVLFRESLHHAIKRVAQEETGLRIQVVKLLDAIEFSPKHAYGHSVSIAFLVSPTGGTFRGSAQGKEIAFFKKMPVPTIPEHKQFLREQKLLKV